MTLTDSFAPDYASLCERFVTTFVPEVHEKHVFVNGVRLIFDPKNAMPVISQEQHYLHDATKPPITVYCIDFELAPGLTEATFIFEVRE